MHDVIVPAEEVQRRTILRRDWVPCKAAFIDCRTPGSDTKDNYSFIGSGVSQNPQQYVNLQEPHGYNLGAAGMPNGTVNSLHLHFTAEVFINFDGEYQLRWGADGKQGEYLSTDGDVISVPSWIFRGFTNVGSDDGILLTVLGQDDTGGIIWGPTVLEDAAGHGLYLTADNRLIDTVAGDVVPEQVELIKPMPQAEIDRLDVFDEQQFGTRVTRSADRHWIERPFLCSALPGGGAALSLVIGYGMVEDRRAVPRLHEPHSFNLAWLRATPGEGMLTHRHAETQVVTVKAGRWQVRLNRGDDEQVVELGPRDSLSVPAGAWRSFQLLDSGPGRAEEEGTGELLVVNGGDGRVRLEWADEVVRHARKDGWVLDPNGYLAPAAVLATATEDD
ncbi:cupin domain-containing protein [Kribbella shirazensis]|uniref:Quercetin dioxygenase-like cupin family protein n=1 Tax=Kribbella shirazensis TaxID=1105143 RepID=A0A7X5VIS0_9ACTN|nr:cupin domain-containing protein [Kribbella shirazensis]NIK61576.1 quercetin dioxygenase-like cupin family protein [Kribbella shirazensis]